MQDLSGFIRKRLPLRVDSLSRGQVVGVALFSLGFVAFLIWVGIRKQLFVEDSSLHWSAMLILLCILLLAGILDDRPTRKLRLFSLGAIFLTAVSHMVVTSPVHFAFTARDDPSSAITTLVILVAGIFITRSWCRYLCPWGYLMGFFHRFSRLRIVQVPNHCNACGKCDSVCDVAAITKGKITLSACQLCYACVDHCPERGLTVVDVWQIQPLPKQTKGEPPQPIPEKAV
jgi:ferredoxin